MKSLKFSIIFLLSFLVSIAFAGPNSGPIGGGAGGAGVSAASAIGDTAFTDLDNGSTYISYGIAGDDTINELLAAIDTAIASLPGGHNALTLAADVDTIMSLTLQVLSLDVQTANTFFAGPVTGVPADPTFRALVSADIPNNAANTSGNAATATLAANSSTLETHAASYFQIALTNPLVQGDVDDAPVDGVTTAPISSNWAYDHAAAADPHAGYMLESNIGFGANNYIKLAASPGTPDTTKFLRDDGTWVTPTGGYTNLTSFIDQTAWRVFYSNTDGDITELALGSDGTYLKSNGASSAPTWATPGGSGDVSKVGTPANYEFGIWTGDGTLKGLAVTGSKVMCTDANGQPIACTNLTDLAFSGYLATSVLSDAAYDASTWDADTTHLASKNAIRDYLESRIPTGADGSYRLSILNNSAISPTASVDEIYPEANIWKVNQNGVESSVAIGPTGGQVVFTGPTSTRNYALPDAAATILYSGGALGTPSSATGTNFTGMPKLSSTVYAATTSAELAGVLSNENAASGGICTNPMTTAGDLITGAASGAHTGRIAAVALGQVLTSKGTSTAPAWDSAPQITSINLGNASDTTITRSVAGVLAVEGVVIPRRIASGTAALGTSEIASGACTSAIDGGTATGVVTTDVINWGFNGDPTSSTGYSPSANGMLTIIAYPASDHAYFKVCNNTASAITPTAKTINWNVLR